MSPWVFVLAYVGALGAIGLLVFWLLDSFESVWTYYPLAALVVTAFAAWHRRKEPAAQGHEAPPHPAPAKAPPLAAAIPTEVLDEWDAPLPIDRSRDLPEAERGHLFPEGFVPDRPFSRPVGKRSRRRH